MHCIGLAYSNMGNMGDWWGTFAEACFGQVHGHSYPGHIYHVPGKDCQLQPRVID
jgi:hypothetical protein